MMHSLHGSTWHKWDFHVHTPYSLLNNQFHCDPYDEDETSFDEYVKHIEDKDDRKAYLADLLPWSKNLPDICKKPT